MIGSRLDSLQSLPRRSRVELKSKTEFIRKIVPVCLLLLNILLAMFKRERPREKNYYIL